MATAEETSSGQKAKIKTTQENLSKDESDVSTLNGQIVKVGEKNEYRTSYKKYNVGLSPIGIIVGNYFVDGGVALHPHLAVKLELGYIHEPYGIDVKGFSSSVYVPFYFRKMYTGFYLEPGLSFHSLETLSGDSSATAFGSVMHLGYHWIWDSGLNLSIAFGVQRNFASDEDRYDDFAKFRASGYFRAGWAFDW